MLNLLLLVVAFAFLPPKAERGPFAQKEHSVYRFVQQLRGRVLGSQLEKGMTKKQVESILGKDPFSLPTGGGSGGFIWFFVHYSELGLSIGYSSMPGKETRLSSVKYYPLVNSQFWATLANNPRHSREGRVQCIHFLFRYYVSPGMSLSDVGRLLCHPNWLDEREIYIYNGTAFAGFIPVDITQDSTTFNFRVFPDLENEMGAVYFRVSGKVSRGEIARLLRNPQVAEEEDPTILELWPRAW